MENPIKNNFKALSKIWIMIITSYSLLTTLLFFMTRFSKNNLDKEINAIFSYISIFSILTLLPAAYYIYGLKKKKGKKKESESQKFELYRNAFVFKIALIESAGLPALMSYYFSKQIQFLMMAAIPILIFLISKPRETHFIEDFYDKDKI